MRYSKTQLANMKAGAAQIQAEWMRITQRLLKEEIHKRGIGVTNTLHNTMRSSSQANVSELSYRLYGMFVDMDVGYGRSLDSNRIAKALNRLYNPLAARRNNRRAKRNMWYSKRMGKEQYKLGQFLMEYYADAGVDAIINAMPVKVELSI